MRANFPSDLEKRTVIGPNGWERTCDEECSWLVTRSFLTSAGAPATGLRKFHQRKIPAINLSSKTSHINIDQESCLVMARILNVSQF